MSKSPFNENSALSTLVDEMGFQREQAELALQECNGNIETAMEKLLQMADQNMPPNQDGGEKSGFAFSTASWPETPPPYSEVIRNPPPYAANYDLPPALPSPFVNQEKGALFGAQKLELPSESDPEMRCSKCFDPIRPDPSQGFSGEMVCVGIKNYFHSECWLKSKGPKCAHCCFPLMPIPDKGFSGRWGTYKDKKYHEECYKQYAGPRCSMCFDVIIANPENGYSGQWVEHRRKQYHEECYMKKLYVEWKSKQA